MGMFGGGYSKPGPGVDKNAPQKKGIFLFFEILTRKIWKLIQTNALYFAVSLPIIIIYYFLAPVSSDFVTRLMPDVLPEGVNEAQFISGMQMGFRSMFAVGIFALWGSGPATAAYTYITRCFVREQHAWIASDFFAKFKENFKQGIVIAIVDVIVYFMAYIAITFYFFNFKETDSSVWLVICYLLCLAMMIYTFMHYYIYQVMITFECSMKQLYRNALILAFAKLPMNLLLTVSALVLLFALFLVLSPMVSIAASIAIWVSLMLFPIVFYTSRAIQKNLLDGLETDDEDDDIERICED